MSSSGPKEIDLKAFDLPANKFGVAKEMILATCD
jgi:hypothetical protein